MNIANHAIGGCVDMTAHDADAAAAFGEFGDVVLEMGDVVDRLFHASFHRLAE